MLITPRLYRLVQTPDKGAPQSSETLSSTFHTFSGWRVNLSELRYAREMLLVHQAGSVRVGEVVRYVNVMIV